MPLYRNYRRPSERWVEIKSFCIHTLCQGERLVIPSSCHKDEMMVAMRHDFIIEKYPCSMMLCHSGYFPSVGHVFADGSHIRNEPYEDTPIQGISVLVKQDSVIRMSNRKDDVVIEGVWDETGVIHLCGNWNEEYSGAGTFTILPVPFPENRGDYDPAWQTINTTNDNHFHDYNEYWIIFAGSGIIVSEGVVSRFAPNDFLATRAGDHHYLPYADSPVKGFYLGTALLGQRRFGHLHNQDR